MGSESDEFKVIMRFYKDLVLSEGLLYRKTQFKGHNSLFPNHSGEEQYRPCIVI